jgi:hypothetical protein
MEILPSASSILLRADHHAAYAPGTPGRMPVRPQDLVKKAFSEKFVRTLPKTMLGWVVNLARSRGWLMSPGASPLIKCQPTTTFDLFFS